MFDNSDPKPEPRKKMKAYEYNKMMTQTKSSRNKYNAVRQSYNGYNYDSRREARHAFELDQRIKIGEVKSWERQFKFECVVNGKMICAYKIDFKVYLTSGKVEYHEVKGKETAAWRIKWKLTKALFPDCKLVLIK